MEQFLLLDDARFPVLGKIDHRTQERIDDTA